MMWLCTSFTGTGVLQEDGHFDGNLKSPMEFIHDAPPIKVHGAVVASFGCESPPSSHAFPIWKQFFCAILLRGKHISPDSLCAVTG